MQFSGTWGRCRLYPNEANAKKANVIFWFIGQSVSDRGEEYTTGLQATEETLCSTLCVIPVLGNLAGKTVVLRTIKLSLRQQLG